MTRLALGISFPLTMASKTLSVVSRFKVRFRQVFSDSVWLMTSDTFKYRTGSIIVMTTFTTTRHFRHFSMQLMREYNNSIIAVNHIHFNNFRTFISSMMHRNHLGSWTIQQARVINRRVLAIMASFTIYSHAGMSFR